MHSTKSTWFQDIKDWIMIKTKWFRQISKYMQRTAIAAYSGLSAFMMILSFFPFCMFLLSLVKYTPLSQETLQLAMEAAFPVSFRSFMSSLIQQLFTEQGASLLPITVISALWLGSKSFMAIANGLDSVYICRKLRNYWVIRFFAILYTILFAVLILSTLTILVFGNSLFHWLVSHFPLIGEVLMPILAHRQGVAFLVMTLFFTILYWHVPARDLSLRKQLPGALFTSAGWLIFSYLYSYYVDHISNYSSFYGTMTMIALLMIWIYACMYILFLGAMLNRFTEQITLKTLFHLLRRNHCLPDDSSQDGK